MFINNRSMSITVNLFLAPFKASKYICRCLSTACINDEKSSNTQPFSKKKKRENNTKSPLHLLAKSKKVVTREDIVELHKVRNKL